MANIATIGVTDGASVARDFTALSGSNGDGSPAVWRLESAKPIFARPVATLLARNNKAKTARHLDMKIIVPYTVLNASTSQEEAVARAMFMGTWILPSNAPQTTSDDLVSFVYGMVANGTMFAQLKTGYSFT